MKLALQLFVVVLIFNTCMELFLNPNLFDAVKKKAVKVTSWIFDKFMWLSKKLEPASLKIARLRKSDCSRIIFLDIDDVMQSLRTTVATRSVGRIETKLKHLDPIAIKMIRDICERFDVKIVVSSTWRLGATVEDFHFFDLPIIDLTCYTGKIRGYDIEAWLLCHPEVTTYAIVDDSSDFLPQHMQYHVHVAPNNGLSFENYRQLEEIFQKPE